MNSCIKESAWGELVLETSWKLSGTLFAQLHEQHKLGKGSKQQSCDRQWFLLGLVCELRNNWFRSQDRGTNRCPTPRERVWAVSDSIDPWNGGQPLSTMQKHRLHITEGAHTGKVGNLQNFTRDEFRRNFMRALYINESRCRKIDENPALHVSIGGVDPHCFTWDGLVDKSCAFNGVPMPTKGEGCANCVTNSGRQRWRRKRSSIMPRKGQTR